MTFEEIFHIDPEEARKFFGRKTTQCLQKALEDFNAVLEGGLPQHAREDKDQPLPSDGGTTFYKGDGYKLIILMSLNGIMKGDKYVHGYIYGPMLSFDPEVMVGNYPAVQHLTFYPGEALKRLLKRWREPK